jgi:hypothetical protein
LPGVVGWENRGLPLFSNALLPFESSVENVAPLRTFCGQGMLVIMKYFQCMDDGELRELHDFSISAKTFPGRSAVAYFFQIRGFILPGDEIVVMDEAARIWVCVADSNTGSNCTEFYTRGHANAPVEVPRKEEALAAIRKALVAKPAASLARSN